MTLQALNAPPAPLIRFVVPGKPVPWMRAKGSGKRRYNDPRLEAYEKLVAFRMIHARIEAGISFYELQSTLRDAQHFIDCDIYVPDRRTRDADNICKAIQDGIRKGCGVDDSGFRMLARAQRFEVDRDNPRVEVTVRRAT